MEIELTVHMPDAELEAKNLHKYISSHKVDGITSKVKQAAPKSGSMTTGLLTSTLTIGLASGMASSVITAISGIIQKFFESKRGDIELSFKLPNGTEFTQKFKYSNLRERDELRKEFEDKFKKAMNKVDIIIAK